MLALCRTLYTGLWPFNKQRCPLEMLLQEAALSQIATPEKICLGPSRNLFQRQLKRKAQAAVLQRQKLGSLLLPLALVQWPLTSEKGQKLQQDQSVLPRCPTGHPAGGPSAFGLRRPQAAPCCPLGAQLSEELCSGFAGSYIVIHQRGLGRGFFPPSLPSIMPWWGANSEASGISGHTQPVSVSFSSRNGACHT